VLPSGQVPGTSVRKHDRNEDVVPIALDRTTQSRAGAHGLAAHACAGNRQGVFDPSLKNLIVPPAHLSWRSKAHRQIDTLPGSQDQRQFKDDAVNSEFPRDSGDGHARLSGIRQGDRQGFGLGTTVAPKRRFAGVHANCGASARRSRRHSEDQDCKLRLES